MLKQGTRLLNFAPEPFMLTMASVKIGSSYKGADYSPEFYERWGLPILQVDLCSDLSSFQPNSFDAIMHNHVLEHVPCEVTSVLKRMNNLIAPGGYHIFSVPIRGSAHTDEEYKATLNPEERLLRFGQDDHMRFFGEIDFEDFLKNAEMSDGMVDLDKIFEEDNLVKAGLPANVFRTITSHRVFVWKK